MTNAEGVDPGAHEQQVEGTEEDPTVIASAKWSQDDTVIASAAVDGDTTIVALSREFPSPPGTLSKALETAPLSTPPSSETLLTRRLGPPPEGSAIGRAERDSLASAQKKEAKFKVLTLLLFLLCIGGSGVGFWFVWHLW